MRSPGIAHRLLTTPLRARNLWRYRESARRSPLASADYLIRGRELSNFTYDIENLFELSEFAAEAVGGSRRDGRMLADELLDDRAFVASITEQLRHVSGSPAFQPGRRIAWYTLVRLSQPRLIVETGTRDGFGTALLARALERNAATGNDGQLLTYDITSAVGRLVPPGLQSRIAFVTGDSRMTMPKTLSQKSVDMLIHDSLHTYEHEWFEFEQGFAHRAPGRPLVLVSDNAHATSALSDFVHLHGGTFCFGSERPVRHFYPGGGIGVAVLPAPEEGRSGVCRSLLPRDRRSCD